MIKFSKIAIGGNNYIAKEDIFSQIIDLLSFSFLKNVKEFAKQNMYSDKNIYSNEQFWNKIIYGNIHPEQIIQLQNFNILEWVPLSPGKYFTDKAIENRNKGMQYFEDFSTRTTFHRRFKAYSPNKVRNSEPIFELNPFGKVKMIEGGLGSIRLTSKLINSKEMYFVCASSSGISHEGIPILIEPNLFNKLVEKIKDPNCIGYNIVGKIKTIPTDFQSFNFDRTVYKYYLLVEDIYREVWDKTKNKLVSIAVTYQTKNSDTNWSFCQFNPDASDRELQESVEWLKDYSIRYDGLQVPSILGDFDEQLDHFDEVEFSLSNIMEGKVNEEQVKQIFKRHKINIHMGDTFENITNSTIINRSTVTNSLNKVGSAIDEDSKNFLKSITTEIENSNNKEAIELIECFHEEIEKATPKKSMLKNIWSGILVALPSLISNTDKIMDIVEKIDKTF